MGFFRRYKLKDFTAGECRAAMLQLEYDVTGEDTPKRIRQVMEDWGCFRELLARHEKNNKSPLDKKKCPYRFHADDCTCEGAGGDR